jgi:hypothetical protein
MVFVEIWFQWTQCHTPEAVRILRHRGGGGSLWLVGAALEADHNVHGIGLWREESERYVPVGKHLGKFISQGGRDS